VKCLMTTMVLVALLVAADRVAANGATGGRSLPQATPAPAPIAPPQDVAYPGTLHLDVDATDAMRGIHHIHETIPVRGMKQLTLLFPQWVPGDPVPPNVLDKVAGLVFSVGGKRLPWRRDPVEQAAFHVNLPQGAKELDVDFEFLFPASSAIGPVLSTPTMMDLQWQSHVLYPAGYYSRRIQVDPAVTLPHDWLFASSLDGATRVGDVVRFSPVSLDVLVDSPVMAARWMRQYILSDDPVPVRLDVAADTASGLVVPPEVLGKYRREVAQAYKLFGGQHYDHYDMLVWLANDFGPAYFEQSRSGENGLPAAFFSDPARYGRSLGIPFHGFVHAWNGIFRVPATMWTANLNVPPRDSLLWVFEGLTMYWNSVLNARSGVTSREDALRSWESIASAYANRSGLQWRTLQDASEEVLIQHGNSIIYPEERLQPWPDWQLNTLDVYLQGQLIWLDIDTLIRERSNGRKSLDDFARGFFGIRNGSRVPALYTFEDLVAGLNAVTPYDWATFLRARVDSVGIDTDLDGIKRAGYRLTWNDRPSGAQQASETKSGGASIRFSVGVDLNKGGEVTSVVWGSAAWRAGLVVGAKVLSVDGQPYQASVIKSAISASRADRPIKLRVARGQMEYSLSVRWKGGLRYPHLVRVPGTPDLLDDILQPRP
jgi:predicted metalloprotease with PDZ domain